MQLTGRISEQALSDIQAAAAARNSSTSKLLSAQLSSLTDDDICLGIRRRLNSPTPPASPDKRTTMSVPLVVMDKLDFLSERTGLARDNIVRLVIENYLDQDHANDHTNNPSIDHD